MPRLPRIHLEGAIYYVTAQGLNNGEIFKEKADYAMYLELLAKYKNQHRFKLFSYSLLPDRLHLLIETGDDATISQIMHDLNSLYTKYFNGRYQKKGHLFESRFKSVLVEKVNYLLAVTRHMHRLPSAENIKDYPYNSYSVYVLSGSSDAKPAVDIREEVKEVLGFLKEAGDAAAYERYCLEADTEETRDLEKRLRRGGVLGSDAFVGQVRGRIQQHVEAQKEESLQTARSSTNKVLVFMIGAMVIVATATSVYLYISKARLETRYTALLKQKETEFAEKTRFENLSPIALAQLPNTVWEIELVPLPAAEAKEILKDKIHFTGGRFVSDLFSEKGFGQTNYSLTKQASGVTTWETIQSAPDGSTVSWRGDWQGDVMKGVVSYTLAGQKPRDFSFFSVKWSYSDSSASAAGQGGAK